MKKQYIFLIVLFVAVLAYFVFFYKTVEAPKEEEKDTPTEQVKVDLEVSDSSTEIVKEGYEVDFKFPVTNNDKINQTIKSQIDELIKTFETEAQSFLPNPAGSERAYTLFSSFESKLGVNYDTFVFLMSVDFGGAHPNHFYKTMTFDKDGNQVTLEDILKKDFDGIETLKKISTLSQEIISEKLGENTNIEMLKDGTKPELENFQNFYIDGESFVFLFEPYAVAPYAYSNQEALIYFSELKK